MLGLIQGHAKQFKSDYWPKNLTGYQIHTLNYLIIMSAFKIFDNLCIYSNIITHNVMVIY